MFIRPFSFRKLANILASMAVLTVGCLCSPTPGAARPDYTRRTKQECGYCHLPGGWFLNDAGKYFEKNRSLTGYKPPAEPTKQTADQKSANPDSHKPQPK
jgi:hypothetical protein